MSRLGPIENIIIDVLDNNSDVLSEKNFSPRPIVKLIKESNKQIEKLVIAQSFLTKAKKAKIKVDPDFVDICIYYSLREMKRYLKESDKDGATDSVKFWKNCIKFKNFLSEFENEWK